MTDRQKFITDCRSIRDLSPLILNITNYVAMNYTAGALLAVGASPLMSFCPEEMEELTAGADALVVNIGCMDKVQAEAMRIAVDTAARCAKPWILDPAGVGSSMVRIALCRELIGLYAPAVIRGNASEICCLAQGRPSGRGVDATLEGREVLESAKALATTTGSVISMSGETDYITDGISTLTIHNGHSLMPKVTAMGCTASALTGAFAAVENDMEAAAANAMALMGLCGENAAKASNGPGTFAAVFIDALHNFDAETEIERII